MIPVVNALRMARLYGNEDAQQDATPTTATLKKYIDNDPSRKAAFKTYKNVHGLQGKVPAYHYYFDFVHGGAEAHPTVLRGEPQQLIINSVGEVQKGYNPKSANVATPLVITGVAHV
jgi:hypothetical protein